MAEVLPVQTPDRHRSPFSRAPLRSSSSHTSFFNVASHYPPSLSKNSLSHSDLRDGSLSSSQSSSSRSTPASSLSLETGFDDSESDDDVLTFPAYDMGRRCADGDDAHQTPPSSPLTTSRPPAATPEGGESDPAATPDLPLISEDDTAIKPGPSQHVDYLSHDWKEEDIWSSWRHIVERRKVYGERSRLENASWRTWAKAQFKLKTVSPETLNWLKDVDVTWLYGPLQPASHPAMSQATSEPPSQLSKVNSFLHKKPILKKRTMSEMMLQNSLSASSLVKQAAAAVQAQQADSAFLERRRSRPIIGRAASDFTPSIPSRTISRDPTDYFSSQSNSGLQSPHHGERKHIRFDEKVEQCIAVECKGGANDDDEADETWKLNDDSDSSDGGVVMMKRSRKKKPLSRTNSRSSISGDSKTIAMLPSTTLKYRTDSPDAAETQPTHSLGLWRSSRLSPSPSQETLRPSNPANNFLLPEDDDEDEDEDPDPWEPAPAFQLKRAGTPTPQSPTSTDPDAQGEPSEAGGLRRTASGMFMPFDEADDDPAPPGLIGRVVDTVNTARDIAHVIWNVGWRN